MQSGPFRVQRKTDLTPVDLQLEGSGKHPRMVSVASPFAEAPGTVRVLAPRQGTHALLAAELRCGELRKPFILDTAGMRHLYFDLNSVQSSMRIEEPAVLVTAYVQKMMAFLLFNRAPRQILLIG